MIRWIMLLLLSAGVPTFAAADVSGDQVDGDTAAGVIQQLVEGVNRDIATFRAGQTGKMQDQQTQLEHLTEQVASLQQALDRARAREQALNAQFQQNRQQLQAQQQRLQLQGSRLSELAGVIRLQAGEQSEHYRQSLTALQLGAQPDLFDALTDANQLPDLSLLQRWKQQLWHQLTHSGHIEPFEAQVLAADGTATPQTVVRMGEFNLVNGSGYLLPTADFSALSPLDRLPDGSRQQLLTELMEGNLTTLSIPFDPTRGELLSRLEEQCPWYLRLDQAGWVGLLIALLFAIGVGVALERSWFLGRTRLQVRRQLRQNALSENNVLGRILLIGRQYGHRPPEQLERKLDEAILTELPELEKRLSLLKLLAALAPMLGLLGTVTGMIATFQNMTLFGSGDPKVLSGGIATALMTTVLGLLAAMPLMLLHSWLAGQSRDLVNLLDQQSAGLLAEQLEQNTQEARP